MPAVFGKLLDLSSCFCSVLNCWKFLFSVTFSCKCYSLASFQQFNQGGVSVGSPLLRDQPWLKVMRWRSSKTAPPGGHPRCGIVYSTSAAVSFRGCKPAFSSRSGTATQRSHFR